MWQAAVGPNSAPSFRPTFLVAQLPSGILGETIVTARDEQGNPTAATIVISPDGDGRGWYIDPMVDDNSAFGESLGATASQALPGSAAYGHYDLLTTLLHELGHVEGFMPQNVGFERYVQNINGSQVFVGPGVTAALVDSDQELNPNTYPGDLLSATLAPGVRELISPLDVQIIDASQLSDAPATTASQPIETPVAVVAAPAVTPSVIAPAIVTPVAAAPTAATQMATETQIVSPSSPVAAAPVYGPVASTSPSTPVGGGSAVPSHLLHKPKRKAVVVAHKKTSQRPLGSAVSHKAARSSAPKLPNAHLASRFAHLGTRTIKPKGTARPGTLH